MVRLGDLLCLDMAHYLIKFPGLVSREKYVKDIHICYSLNFTTSKSSGEDLSLFGNSASGILPVLGDPFQQIERSALSFTFLGV